LSKIKRGRRVAQLVCKRCRAIICEFCESSFDASKTDQCYQCECGREGRNHPKDTTLREDCEETGRALKSVGLSKRVDPNPAEVREITNRWTSDRNKASK